MAIPSRNSGAGGGSSGDALQILSSLLASHRAHLLSLYTALGHSNPEAHVSTKITDLHSSLVATVQQQAKEAEDEVEGLKKEAAEVEERVIASRNRLGVAETSLREGLDGGAEENLLRRLARLKQLEADLEGVIETRRKQVEALEKRLNEHIPVMGKDAVRNAFARGNTDGQAAESTEDLSLDRVKRLEGECAAFGNEVTRRNQLLVSHLQEIFNLWADLGITPSIASEATDRLAPALLGLPCDPSSSDSSDFDPHVLRHLGIKGTAIQPSGEAIPSGRCEPEELLPTDANLDRALRRREWLEGERSRCEGRIQELYDQVGPLWNRLGVPESEQEEFIESWKGLSQACIAGYQAELERMQAARAEHMCLFVAKEREQIENLWNQMYVGEEERASLVIMQSEDYSEDLLLAHETERKRLEEEVTNRASLLDLLGRYFSLLQEAHELEVAEKDPNRYAKGKRGVPGQLLREEKIRKRVAKEKPKLEQELQTFIPEWENARGKAFLVNGSRFLEDLVARLEQETAGKENSKRTRPGGVPPSSAGPIKRQQTGNGAPSRPTSPTKRPRTATVSRVQPQRTGSASTSYGGVQSHRTGPMTAQKTGTSRLTAQMTGAMSGGPMRGGPSMLVPQSTGASTNYNPVTPTPNYGGPGVMLAPASTTLPRPGIPRSAPMGIPSGWGHQRSVASIAEGQQPHERLFSPDGISASDSTTVSTFGRKMSFRPRPSVAGPVGIAGSRSVSGSTAASGYSFASGRSGSSFATSVGSK